MNGHGPARWSGPGKKSVRALENPGEPAVAVAETYEVDATDAAKALAAEHNIDLATVTGTGSEGRVTKDDVSAVIDASLFGDEEPTDEPQPDEPADSD